MEWSLGVEPWSGVLERILKWNEVRFGVIVALFEQDLVVIDQFLVNALDSLCHMLQSSFEYLFHNW